MATREVPGLRVGAWTIVPSALGLAVGVLVLGRLALQAQRRPPATGSAAMVGEIGRTRTAMASGQPGQVDVHGEIWRAVSRTPLAPGVSIRVAAIDGLTLEVEPLNGSPSPGEHGWKT